MSQLALVEGKLPQIIERFDDLPIASLPKSYAACDKGTLDSVKNFGVLAPLILVLDPNSKFHKYRVVDGLRRLYAAEATGTKTVPAIVYDMEPVISDTSTVMLNMKRQENPVAELQAIERVMGKAIGDVEIANATGIPKSKIAQLLKFRLLIPELRALFNEYKLAPSLAKRIVTSHELRERQDEILAKIQSAEHGKLLSKHLDAMLEARRKEQQKPLIEDAADWKGETKAAPAEVKIGQAVLERAIDFGFSAFSDLIGEGTLPNTLDLTEAIQDAKGFVYAQVHAVLHSAGVRIVKTASQEGPEPDELEEVVAEGENESAPEVTDAEGPTKTVISEYPEEGWGADAGGKPEPDIEDEIDFEASLSAAVGAAVVGKLKAAGITTMEALRNTSVWSLIRKVDGVGAGTAEKLHELGFLHPFYDPHAQVVRGYAVGQLVQGKSHAEPQYWISKVTVGATGGIHTREFKNGEQTQEGLSFWKWAKFDEFFEAI